MMRKDGYEHQDERRQIFPSFSPRTIMQVWRAKFERAAEVVLEGSKDRQEFDLVWAFTMPVSGAALVAITGLREMTPTKINEVSQAIIDGCANYLSNPRVTQACHLATADIDTHICGMFGAANWDHSVFENPEVYDLNHDTALAIPLVQGRIFVLEQRRAGY